jgi:DNA invertase Pin-like site-specific DNA recombinase
MVAQIERRFIKDRQRNGIEWAKSEGVYRGGKRRLNREQAATMSAAGFGASAIARALGCSRMQVYRIRGLKETFAGELLPTKRPRPRRRTYHDPD